MRIARKDRQGRTGAGDCPGGPVDDEPERRDSPCEKEELSPGPPVGEDEERDQERREQPSHGAEPEQSQPEIAPAPGRHQHREDHQEDRHAIVPGEDRAAEDDQRIEQPERQHPAAPLRGDQPGQDIAGRQIGDEIGQLHQKERPRHVGVAEETGDIVGRRDRAGAEYCCCVGPDRLAAGKQRAEEQQPEVVDHLDHDLAAPNEPVTMIGRHMGA